MPMMKRKRTYTASARKKFKAVPKRKSASYTSKKYRAATRKVGVASYIGKKHIKSRRSTPVKKNSKLDKRIRMISKIQAQKDLPVFDAKQVRIYAPHAPANNVQTHYETGGLGGIFNPSFDLCSSSELRALVQYVGTGFPGDISGIKFNVLYAKKEFVLTNNTTAYYHGVAMEWIAKDDFSAAAVANATASLAALPAQVGSEISFATIGVRPELAATFRTQYKTTNTNFVLAPGGTYTHTIYCSNVDIDFSKWMLTSTTAYNCKAGITKGAVFTLYPREVSTSVVGEAQFATTVAATDALTMKVTTHYKITLPEALPSEDMHDLYYRSTSFGAGAATGLVSTFDRTALKLPVNA